MVEKCYRCCFHMTGQRFDPFRCLFAVHIYIYIHSTYTVHIYVQAQKTERKSMPDHAMARKVNASDAREFCNERPTKKKKKLASSKNNLRAKKDLEANLRRFCAQAIAKPQPEKCRNVAVGTH